MKSVKEKNKHPTFLKIPDRLWDEIKNILPREKPLKIIGSRPIITYRKILAGILYILRPNTNGKSYYLPSMVLVLIALIGFRDGINRMSSKMHGSDY